MSWNKKCVKSLQTNVISQRKIQNKAELPVKRESNLCWLIQIVAITCQSLLQLSIWVLISRGFILTDFNNFSIFYNHEKREIKDPRN